VTIFGIFAFLFMILLAPCPVGAQNQTSSSDLAAAIYEDPNRFFRIRPPAGWVIKTYPDDPRGKVKLIGSQGANILVIGQSTQMATLEALIADSKAQAARIETKYRDYSVKATTESTFFRGLPAVRGTTVFPGRLQQLSLEFLFTNRYYNISYVAPTKLYESFLPIVEKCFESIDPIPGTNSTDEARKHIVASKIRLAELNIELGFTDTASQAIEEGLQIDPTNEDLLLLQQQINSR
jgi:hypothetical protein